ncbi:MAG: TatD family hydrolase [Oscillospiraceae bacterium]|nr:TatD family hydrolase [Oscillospiraceae bacterium]
MDTMYFDTHAHYDDEWFDEDRDEVLSSLPEAGVSLVVNCGCDEKSSQAAVDLAHQYDFIYAAVGWHPHDVKTWDDTSADKLRRWAEDPKVVAIGEIGLDYHYDLDWKDLQHEVLEKQLCLAEELDLPVIIHDREAHGDCMDILRRHPNVRGEFHCYSGSAEMAKEILSWGWYLGFNGSITMQGARRALETLAMMPSDRMLLETDCPYLAPMPRTNGRRNDSRRLPPVAQVMADTLKTTPELVAEVCMENGRRFFGIE